MRYLKLMWILLIINSAYPLTDEALIAAAMVKGKVVYKLCLIIPPKTPPEVAACKTAYLVYNTALQAINAPFPLAPSTTPSMYAINPFDVCRYETSHFVFTIPASLPYCPAI